LVEKTDRGWRAHGVGNREPDRTLVRRDDLVGVVDKAYGPLNLPHVAGRADVERKSTLAAKEQERPSFATASGGGWAGGSGAPRAELSSA
jgi:hypothetical protein